MNEAFVSLADPSADHRDLAEEIEAAALAVLRSGRYVLGPENQGLEEDAREYTGASFCLSVTSGTDALLLALMTAGVGPGEEVITTPFTFFATAGAIHRLGARPVFADIDPETFNLDPEDVRRRITPKTRAIVPVHLYGRPANMHAFEKIAKEHDLFVLEDAAQAVGASYAGKACGTIARFGTYSFFPSKNLGAAGDAGMLFVRGEDDFEKARSLRVHGETSRYHHRFVGGNFRLSELQAAVLRVKWRRIPEWTEIRRRNAARYLEMLDAAGLSERVHAPRESEEERGCYHQFTIRVPERDRVREHLQDRGIASGVYYPVPLHLQECFAFLGGEKGALPHAERAAEEVVSLPVGHRIGSADQERVVAALAEALP